MPRMLYLLRHADALPIEGDFEADLDFDRHLSEKGLTQCARLKTHLQGLRFDKVLCSAARRTMETYETAIAPAPVDMRQEFYNATEATLLHAIQTEDTAEHLLVIAHNPGVSDLARTLGLIEARSLSPCSLASFTVTEAWQKITKQICLFDAFYAP